MANTATLPLTETPQKPNRSQIRGLLEDTAEYTFDTIFGGLAVNEGPVKGLDLEQIMQMPEHEVSGLPQKGSMTGFQERRTPADIYPQETTQLEQELSQARIKIIMNLPTEEKRAEVNELNELQSHYQGSVDEQGNVTIYHAVNAKRKQAENLGSQIRMEREEKLAKKRAASGSGDQNKDFENRIISWNAG